MTLRKSFIRAIERTPVLAGAVERKRRRRRQRDWSRVVSAGGGGTSVRFHVPAGLGDLMIARQFCHEFDAFVGENGDPRLGQIVITAGAWDPEFRVKDGDHVVYWWWSMDGRDDWLDHYLDGVNVKPDLIACLSPACQAAATGRGFRSLFLPLAAGSAFVTSDATRAGIGFAGSRGHKDGEQEEAIVGPFIDDPSFEWVDDIESPEQLAAFYQRKAIVLGMTEMRQRQLGMVNNRVFEVLATGTPFIMSVHPTVNEVLGFEFPFQSNGRDETVAMAARILADYGSHLRMFEGFAAEVRARHSYRNRIQALVESLG